MRKSRPERSDPEAQSASQVPSVVVEDEFGSYQIKAGRLSGNFTARAFPGHGSHRRGLVAEASGDSEQEAIDNLKSLLRERTEQRSQSRRWDDGAEVSVPSQEEFSEALWQSKLSKSQISMLKAQATAGEDGLSIDGLMSAGGYRSPEMAIKVLAKVGSSIADFLGINKIPQKRGGKIDAAVALLVLRKNVGDGTPATWIMHDELRHAVLDIL